MSRPHRARWRPGPFEFGTGLGFALPLLLFCWLDSRLPHPNVDISSTGRDLSAHGVVRLEITDAYGWKALQACRDGCDDLRLQTESGDNAFVLRALNAEGRCVACSGGGYVTHGMLTRLRVRGADALRITDGELDVTRDARGGGSE